MDECVSIATVMIRAVIVNQASMAVFISLQVEIMA